MNSYPLDEVALNGYATFNGVGSGAMDGSASGRAATVARGTVSAANMQMAANAEATRHRLGSSNALMEMSVLAEGMLAALGKSNALMQFVVLAMGQSFSVVGSTATMVMDNPLSRGGMLAFGESDTDIEMLAEAHGIAAHGVTGRVRADLTLDMSGRAWTTVPIRAGGEALGWTYATARATYIAHARALAELGLDAKAIGKVGAIVKAEGSAALALELLRAIPDSYRQINGEADVAMALEAIASMYRVVVLPEVFYPAPRSRIIQVRKEQRIVRVQKGSRIIKVRE
ncbi:hypothetical protein M0D69_13995 [Caballeronia sp. SEWSISQ10-4 2]|uniref:hypothetical protein n=1 Tax=Caballeronia sp. SEWSISQ10-4 2 TaxID=2937438 RepID=UPI002655FFEE|nr:hypothetical protein [Caballeronia sp. SEWSISQ10-4 2]MDN7179106.1 hypothetical protein [Caballeronia sp. SEWSISQ10-4 2]